MRLRSILILKRKTDMNQGKTLAVIGERPKNLGGYQDTKTYDDIKRMLVWAIKKLNREIGVDRVMTTGAQGTGQIAWAAAREAQSDIDELAIDIVAPFAEQDRLWDEDGIYGKRRYREMCDQAESDPRCSVTALKTRNELAETTVTKACYDCNHTLVDASDILLIVWGQLEKPMERDPKGSAIIDALVRAKNQNKPVAVLDWCAPELNFFDENGKRVKNY